MLHESSRDFIGRRLWVATHAGWGWTRLDDSRPGAEAKSTHELPPGFHARLLELWTYDGEQRGGIARVEEPGHDLDGFVACFSTRHEGVFRLDQADVMYNIDIGPQEPIYEKGRWPFPRGVPSLHGYAAVRAIPSMPT